MQNKYDNKKIRGKKDNYIFSVLKFITVANYAQVVESH